MTKDEERAVRKIREIYAHREPAGTDAWSPLHHDLQMWHRSRLMIEASRCLRLIPGPLEDLRVLDVGCGTGRSSRLLVDLGVNPQNLLAIDFRESAIAYAAKTNPAIRFQYIAGFSEWPQERFDLVVQCVAFSSLPGSEIRRQAASLIERSIGDDGYVFWWDLMHAIDFADGQELNPKSLFPRLQPIRERRVSLRPDLCDSLRSLRGMGKWISSALGPLGHRPTHLVALMQSKA
jgi:SAM-dependent methyltransferase